MERAAGRRCQARARSCVRITTSVPRSSAWPPTRRPAAAVRPTIPRSRRGRVPKQACAAAAPRRSPDCPRRRVAACLAWPCRCSARAAGWSSRSGRWRRLNRSRAALAAATRPTTRRSRKGRASRSSTSGKKTEQSTGAVIAKVLRAGATVTGGGAAPRTPARDRMCAAAQPQSRMRSPSQALASAQSR